MRYQHYIYEIINDEIKIIQYIGNEQFAVIPAYINQLPVTILGNKAFYYKNHLHSLRLPQTLKHIEAEAISGCKLIEGLMMPKSLETVDEKAFYDCERLKSIYLAEHVQSIDASAFDLCDSLQNIYVSPDNPYYQSVEGILYNKDLTSIIKYPIDKEDKTFVLPHNTTCIAPHAFAYNEHLKNIILTNIEEIGDYAFSESMDLKSVVLSSHIKNIGCKAFDECLYLTLYVYKNTYAYYYVKENKLNYQTIIRSDQDD
ncbi:MAG: leucine-rich repeat domain-containing protein [Erysipelotrichaceae bacterium]|nr:leucine-rich repeat domain-containing protein [Erysipelotrichaceae bacterium]